MAMPDVLEASPLTLVRWRPEDVDEVLDAVRLSFRELQQWMPWAQTVPTADEQRAAVIDVEELVPIALASLAWARNASGG